MEKQMAKKKQSKWVRGILFAAGIIFICAGVYFFIHGIHTYIQQVGQWDWQVTTATVINVDERRKSGGGRHNRSHRTVYDIYYQYEADGDLYTDVIYGVNAGKKYGESFDIKYDPKAPQNSTHNLQPAPGAVVSGVLGALVFGAAGLYLARSAVFKKKQAPRRRKKATGTLPDEHGKAT